MIDFGWRKSEGHGDIIQMKILSEIDYIFMYVAFIRFVTADWKKLQTFYFKQGNGCIVLRISFQNIVL